MESYKIRKIRIQDADRIGEIQEAVTKSSVKIDFKKILNEQLRSDEDASFVADLEGRVVGYMISYTFSGGFGLERSAWIATLGVDPDFMGQGIGKALAAEILRVYEEKGIKNIFTSVPWDSVDLLSFFKTLGFDRSRFINLNINL